MCYSSYITCFYFSRKLNIMKQWESPMCGTTKISNPITLQRWVDNGKYKELIDEGYIFAPYCGRFRFKLCECSKCRHKRFDKDELIQIINKML